MAKSDFSNTRLPPLEWLRVFEAAGRTGNFTAAAKELNLTQAAVSQRIRSLEKALDVTLFRRLHRGVELTTDGEIYLPHVSAALGQLRRSTSDLFGRHRRKIRIASPASIATFWIPQRLPVIAARAPGLEVSVSTINRSTDYAALKADFEVRFGDGNWPDRRCWELYREELVPACAPELLRGTDDWRTLPAIAVTSSRLGWRDWGARFDTEIPNRISIRVDSFSIGLQASLAGAGVILASKPLCQDLFESGKLQSLSSAVLPMSSGHWLCNDDKTVMDKNLETFVSAICA